MKYQIIDATVVIDGKNEILPRADWLGESEESADEVLQKNRERRAGNDEGVRRLQRRYSSQLEKVPNAVARDVPVGEKENIRAKTIQRAVQGARGFVKKQPGGPWWGRWTRPSLGISPRRP